MSLTEEGRPVFIIRFDGNNTSFIGNNGQGRTEQNESALQGAKRACALSPKAGNSASSSTTSWCSQIGTCPEINEAKLRFDCDHQAWSLRQLHLLGGDE